MESLHTPATEVARQPPSEESVREGHETRDVNPRAIVWLAAGIVVMGLVVHGLLLVMLWQFQLEAAQSDPELSPLAEKQPVPPEPHLQNTPMRDYERFRAKQTEQRDSYGWIDKEGGVVHIPVSRAIELALEQGLPSPTKKSEPQSQVEEKEKEQGRRTSANDEGTNSDSEIDK